MTASNKLTTLTNLLEHQTCIYYQAELELKTSLRRWIPEAGSLSLKTVLQKYLAFVEDHIKMIQELVNEEKVTSVTTGMSVMEALINEADEKIAICSDVDIKNACILASIQSINHFKISSYGTAAAYARELGMADIATLFHEAEGNEKEIDQRLTEVAESEINGKAKAPFLITK
jgi:ferritin-like metal-binding protein YciE